MLFASTMREKGIYEFSPNKSPLVISTIPLSLSGGPRSEVRVYRFSFIPGTFTLDDPSSLLEVAHGVVLGRG